MVLQFFNLAEDSLWGDEIFTAIFSAKPPTETIAFAASDIHPPLYYLLVGSLSHTPLWPAGVPGPITDWLWRWPSAMAGVLAVAVTYRLGAVLGNRRVGFDAALLLTVAPVAVKYGQEARMHALFMLFSAWSTLLLAQALKTNRRKYWIGYSLITVLNLYTMYFSFIIIAVHGAWVLVDSLLKVNFVRHRSDDVGLPWPSAVRHFLPWLVAMMVALVAYLPWWPILLKILTFRAAVGAVEGGVGSPLAFLPKAIVSVGPFGGSAWLFLGLYWLGLWYTWRSYRRSLPILGGSWLLLPLLLPIFLGDSRALHLRYAFVLPVYLIFIALALEWIAGLFSPIRRTQMLGAGVLLLICLSLSGLITVYRQQKPDWRGAAALVASKAGPGDLIITGPLWDDGRFFSYYYPQPERVLPPPTLVFRLPDAAAQMAEVGGRLWLVTRYPPGDLKRFISHELYGVTVLEQTEPNYDPAWMIQTGAELCQRAARSAYDWAETMEAGGVLNPDPRSSQAAAYRCVGDVYAVAGDYAAALKPYQKMVEAFPGWAGGYVLLAKTYLAMDNLPASVEAFGQAVRFNPAWQIPQSEQAQRLAAESRWTEAVALYQAIIDE